MAISGVGVEELVTLFTRGVWRSDTFFGIPLDVFLAKVSNFFLRLASLRASMLMAFKVASLEFTWVRRSLNTLRTATTLA